MVISVHESFFLDIGSSVDFTRNFDILSMDRSTKLQHQRDFFFEKQNPKYLFK